MTTHTLGIREHWLPATALGAGDWLSLAAAPTFATMALLTGALGGGPQDMSCMAMHGASPLHGMAAMYALMALFHSARWLKLVAGGRSGASIGLPPHL